MPRKHTHPKHVPFRSVNNEGAKKRYPTKPEAERAAEIIMLQNPSLELTVYQGPDGGWYLTRKTDNVY